MKEIYFSNDVSVFLFLLSNFKVKYVIVGSEAVIYYGYSRLTGDINIYYERNEKNITKLYTVLNQLLKEGMILQFGVHPNRIDLINIIESVNFNSAWKNKKDIRLYY